ncbi:MAG: DNA repair protein RadC [Nonlabens sp.]
MDKSSTYASIKSWSLDDRPREKLLARGSSALSDAELIAILIGSGTRKKSAVELSREILAAASNSLDILGRTTIKDLMNHNGVGEAKAVTIAASMELGKRRAMTMPLQLTKISCSEDAYRVLQPILGELPHEEFWVLMLNNSNKVIAKEQISKGGFTGTMVDSRIVFQKALLSGAVAIILAHNHPSGTLIPSNADKQLTHKLVKAAETLEIKILDHIIVTQHKHYSFADAGTL